MGDNAQGEGSGTLHSIERSADILRKSHWTLRWRVKHGYMQPVRLGRRLFFESRELLRVLEEERRKGGK